MRGIAMRFFLVCFVVCAVSGCVFGQATEPSGPPAGTDQAYGLTVNAPGFFPASAFPLEWCSRYSGWVWRSGDGSSGAFLTYYSGAWKLLLQWSSGVCQTLLDGGSDGVSWSLDADASETFGAAAVVPSAVSSLSASPGIRLVAVDRLWVRVYCVVAGLVSGFFVAFLARTFIRPLLEEIGRARRW
jgi:hypothetical protein